MEYTVIKAFIDIDGITKQICWKVELTLDRAIRLYRWGFIAGPISHPVPPTPWQVIGGSRGKITSREENIAGLASAIGLANDCKASINASYADVADHTAGADAVNVIVSPNPLTLVALITLVTEMITSYVAHDDDAELAANWVFHAAQEAGEHSLASVVAPINLQECITRLNDIKAKYNGHDADNTCHGVGSNHQVAAADAAYGAAIRVVSPGVLPNDLAVWGILDSGTGTVVGVAAAAGNGYVDFTFDSDPQNDAIISYLVTRKLNI